MSETDDYWSTTVIGVLTIIVITGVIFGGIGFTCGGFVATTRCERIHHGHEEPSK